MNEETYEENENETETSEQDINEYGEVNENENTTIDTESSEQLSSNDPVSNPDTGTCTYVYTTSGEVTCAEYLITPPEVTTDPSPSEKEGPEATTTPVVITIDPTDALITKLDNILQNQEEILTATDTTEALQIYQDVQAELEQINDYVALFFGLYFIGWIFSQLNSWRRNNKS